MRALRLILICTIAAMPTIVSAQEKDVFMPKRSFDAGIQAAYLNMNSDNSDILLLLNQINAGASIVYLAPHVEFTYKDNRALGIRMNYCSGNVNMADNVDGRITRLGGSVYHRNYFGLDRKNRLAAFAEFSASVTGGRTFTGKAGDYSSSVRANISFSPGLMYFVMNNVSVSLSLGLAGLSYNSAKCYTGGVESGYSHRFGADFGLDLLGCGYGISFYF